MVVALRPRVFVETSLPQAVSDELVARDLLALPVSSALADMRKAIDDPECRALLIHVDNPTTDANQTARLAAILDDLARPALDNGVLVTLVVQGSAADQVSAIQAVYQRFKLPGIVDTFRYRPNIIAWVPNVVGPLAQACARHEPGPAWRPLTVVMAGDRPIEQSNRRLLERAFSDCDRLEVRLLQERSARVGRVSVYRVQPGRADRPDPVPFIVKIGHPEVIDAEEGATAWACGDHTPYPYFPPLTPERNVSSRDRRALVSQFVDRAILFDDYIRSHSPAVAVASLFDGPLRCWRSNSRSEQVRIGQYVLENGLVRPWLSAYQNVYRRAHRVHGGVRKPRLLISALRNLPAIAVNICGAHGDLHVKNLFVRENSVDIVLIDFNRAGEAPASRDPAELEVSLAFSPVAPGEAAIDAATLQALYSGSLLKRTDLARQGHPRVLAIEQVRRQVAGAVTEAEYSAMVGAHCLYFARKGNVDAYLAANRLI